VRLNVGFKQLINHAGKPTNASSVDKINQQPNILNNILGGL